MSRNDLPNEKAPNFNARLRETLMTYLGKSGDPLDRGITLRDLVDSGIVSIADLRAAQRGGSLPLAPGNAVTPTPVTTTEPDLTPPPTPTGLTAVGAITTILIEHDTPIYTQGHGHLRTHVYGAIRSSQNDPAPVFGDAAEITQFSGTVTSYATNPSTTWHLWAKWESVDGVLSANPAGGVNGVEVTTGQDVQLLLDALTGQLTEDQLYAELGARIDLIDGNGVGSVNARVLAEAQARTAAITAEATARAADILAEATARGAAITTEATTRQNADTSLSNQITTLSASVDANAAAITTEATARANADTAEAQARMALASTVAGNMATVQNDYYTKTATDSAIASATSTLVSNTALSTALSSYVTTATLTNDYYTKTATDSAISSATSSLVSTTALSNALGNYVTSATLTSSYYTKTQTDSAISSATSSLVSTTALATALGDYTNTATLTTNYYTKTATDSAISSATSSFVSTSALNTALGNYTTTAALSANYYTKAAGQDLEGKYTVKVDLNGYVTGFGLASVANNGTATSTFSIRADSFYIANPAGPGISPAMPFIVRTTATTIGGVAVPAGVYMTDAFIQNGTITNAKIADAAIDSAKISSLIADRITSGSIQVGTTIQSSNYSATAKTGWRIDGSGNLDANNATFRGTVDASTITGSTISGTTITGSTITGATIQTSASGQRVQIDTNGILFLTGATSGKYGGFKYGAKKYGSGVLVYFNDVNKRVPFYVSAEQNVADIHLYNRTAVPTGATYETGDMIVVDGKLKIYVAALGGWKTVAYEP